MTQYLQLFLQFLLALHLQAALCTEDTQATKESLYKQPEIEVSPSRVSTTLSSHAFFAFIAFIAFFGAAAAAFAAFLAMLLARERNKPQGMRMSLKTSFLEHQAMNTYNVQTLQIT